MSQELAGNIHEAGANGLSKYGESFLEFLDKFYSKKELGDINNKDLITKACTRMELSHEGQTRNNNKPYYIHPYNVAKIYCLVHQGNISTRGIVAAIIHDNIENAPKSRQQEDYNSIKKEFGKEAALICATLSKKDIGSRNEEYFNRFQSLKTIREYLGTLLEQGKAFSSDELRAMAFKIALIKICDRIHNLRTMEGFSIEKIKNKIVETQTYLLPIAQEIGVTHPRVIQFLNEAIFVAQQQVIRGEILKTSS